MTQTFHTFMDYYGDRIRCHPGPIVPQTVYHVPGRFDRLPSIPFIVNNVRGIRLSSVLATQGDIPGLADGNSTPVLANDGVKITLRILWPGYESWHDVIHVFDHTVAARPASLAKIARLIATSIRKFIQSMATVRSTERDPGWWVSNVSVDDLVLLELRHVSKGSWQPVLCRIVH